MSELCDSERWVRWPRLEREGGSEGSSLWERSRAVNKNVQLTLIQSNLKSELHITKFYVLARELEVVPS